MLEFNLILYALLGHLLSDQFSGTSREKPWQPPLCIVLKVQWSSGPSAFFQRWDQYQLMVTDWKYDIKNDIKFMWPFLPLLLSRRNCGGVSSQGKFNWHAWRTLVFEPERAVKAKDWELLRGVTQHGTLRDNEGHERWGLERGVTDGSRWGTDRRDMWTGWLHVCKMWLHAIRVSHVSVRLIIHLNAEGRWRRRRREWRQT